jgi:DNA mismatch repair protein MutL
MTMQRIHILPPLLANQIAAGEVVERPASVIKELLENSLDASAHKIDIDIENGGIDLIRIRDDGHGIEKDDLALALSRHATSKIISQDDLQHIASLGFRGEALASIAAVSRLTLTSRTEAAEHAWKIVSDPLAQSSQVEAAAHPIGTTIEMRDLFYNVPARRKFLKSERTELGHIEAIVQQIVLSRHDIDLTLRHQQKNILQVKAAQTPAQINKRIAAVCGTPFINQSLQIEFTDGTLHLHGWLGLPTAARNQTDNQFFFVNGRIVRDKLLNHAVKFAYQNLLPEGRHPAYVLYLTLPHDAVDVNVHPTKHEVRFYESRHVHDFVAVHLQRALLQDNTEQHAVRFIEEQPIAADIFANESIQPSSHLLAKPHFTSERRHAPTISWPQMAIQENAAIYNVSPQTQSSLAPSSTDAISNMSPHLSAITNEITRNISTNSAIISDKILGILPIPDDTEASMNAYILLQHPQGLMIIDALQAEKAIAYETLLTASTEHPLISQPLLLPPSIYIAEQSETIIEQLQAHLAIFGIKLSRMANTKWLVRELPTVLKNMNLEKVIQNLLTCNSDWENLRTSKLLALNLQFIGPINEASAQQLLNTIDHIAQDNVFKYSKIISWQELMLEENRIR